jgi:alpha-1,3-rhamnosyl/mannosyltransferase
MKRVRIGIEAGLASSKHPTGVEHYARSLLYELLRLETQAVEWFVYLSPHADTGTPLPPAVNARFRPDVNTLIKTPWLIGNTWRDRLDVIYSFGHRLPTGCCGRRVITVYDTAFDQFPDCYPPGDAQLAHAEVSASLSRAQAAVVPSAATRDALVANYGYAASNVHVMLGGYRSSFRPGAPGSLPDRVTEAGIQAPFLLSVGRLDRRKNVERVIEAYRLLLRQGVPCGGLVIVGPDDTGTAEVHERLRKSRVAGERIVTTGYLGDTGLVPLYQAAAVFAYPSLAEGFGLPVLEAMACGTPTVTSKVSSMPEVADSAALLVDPMDTTDIANAIGRILTTPSLRDCLSEAGIQRARELTWTRSAELVLDGLLKTAGAR